jgi:hypothetical protein
MPETDLYTAIMAIPGANQALDFLQKQASGFAYIPSRLDTVRRQLAAIQAQGDATKRAQATAALGGLVNLQSLYASASAKVADVLTAVRLGVADPLALVPKLLGAAAQAALLFKSVDAYEQSVQKLAAGTLTTTDLARLKQGAGATLSPAVKVVLVVGGAWLLWRMVRR